MPAEQLLVGTEPCIGEIGNTEQLGLDGLTEWSKMENKLDSSVHQPSSLMPYFLSSRCVFLDTASMYSRHLIQSLVRFM